MQMLSEVIRPDPRNRVTAYCSATACRAASKAAAKHLVSTLRTKIFRAGERRRSSVAVAPSGYCAKLDVSALRYKLSRSNHCSIINGQLVHSPLQEILIAQPAV